MPAGGRRCLIATLLLFFVAFSICLQRTPTRCDPTPSRALPCTSSEFAAKPSKFERSQHWNATLDDRLLVIVIAGGSRGLVYPSYRSIWTAVADRVASFGVHVYLVSMDSSVNTTTLSNHRLVFPGEDSLVPGVLNQTMLALDYVHDRNLPGSKAPYVLRTNLSSFWQFNKLLTWLWDKATVFAGYLGVGGFPSGSGTIMRADVCEQLRTLPRAQLLNTTLADDVAIGVALRSSINATNMPRRDFLGGSAGPEELSSTYFHYRIKSTDELHDIGIMHLFFSTWYEEARMSPDQTYQWQHVSPPVKS